jgi:hypothetical protein
MFIRYISNKWGVADPFLLLPFVSAPDGIYVLEVFLHYLLSFPGFFLKLFVEQDIARICNLANIISFVIRPPSKYIGDRKKIANNHLVFLIRGMWVDGAHASCALYQPSLFYVSFEPRWPQMSLSSPNPCSNHFYAYYQQNNSHDKPS